MRIVGGQLGGRSLRAPRGTTTRPTSDRVREAVFSILGDISGARVLDLFAGSGAMGFEALSRGALEATLVDISAGAIAVILQNVKGLAVGAEVRQMSAIAFLERASAQRRQYDLVFLDPPYRLAGELGARLSATLPPVLAPDARVVSESDRRSPLELEMPLESERRYGDTLIRIHAPHR
jgi:16S rRNA (guanine966-N2)-methyltransferase